MENSWRSLREWGHRGGGGTVVWKGVERMDNQVKEVGRCITCWLMKSWQRMR